MYPTISQGYTIADASIEILVMLFVSFLLGFILAWFIRNATENQGEVYSSTYPTHPEKIDNLKLIEGIGPKIEELLNEANIYSFEELHKTDYKYLEKILEQAGPKFTMHDPKTWADQAHLASQGKWAELKEYQDILNGGKEKT